MSDETYLREQAWNYFVLHASQRMTIFNFYLVSSSLIASAYFASFKTDSNLQSARPLFAFLLCIIAYVFWRLEQRTKFLIKNAEQALLHFEHLETGPIVSKVFSSELKRTSAARRLRGRGPALWYLHPSYSNCFNLVFLTFFLVGLSALITDYNVWPFLKKHLLDACH
jgi:hypothetical protein